MKHSKLQIALAAVGLIAASTAQAHVQIGTYRGVTPAGDACSFDVRRVSFENALRHPLNERVEVAYAGASYQLSHPALVDLEQGTVLPDSSQLRSTGGLKTGALAVVLKMSHEEGKEGPTEFIVLSQDYKDASKSTKTICQGLQFGS